MAEIGAGNDGVIEAAMLEQAGVSLSAAYRLRRRGLLVSVGKGVDRLRDHPFDLRSRCRAALALAGRESVLGLRSAARLHGCWAYRSNSEVEVLTFRDCDHGLSIARLVQTRWLPDAHRTEVDGLPVTSIARTFFDLCGDPEHGLHLRHPYHERRMRQLYNDCLARRGMTFAMEAAVLSTLARRGRRGTRLVRKILRSYGPKHEPTHSDLETIMLELVRAHRLPDPERQAVITGPDGFIGTVDFAWRAAKLVVEVDSSWHDGPIDEEVDAERDLRLKAAGYTVKRYRFGQIVLQPESVALELGTILRGSPRGIIPGT